MRDIRRIYVHCSASEWGTVEEIDRWHKERGWWGIGYHYLITNIFPTWAAYKDATAVPEYDGKVWPGRPEDIVGAHVLYDNASTLGICLIGNEAFSSSQLDSLADLCVRLCRKYGLNHEAVRGHKEYWTDRGEIPQKSCPNLPMPDIRKHIAALLNPVA